MHYDEDGLIEKSEFELDRRIGAYDNVSLEANTPAEAMLQKALGVGVAAMVAVPLVLPAASAIAGAVAPVATEAAMTVGVTAYTAQSAIAGTAAAEAGYVAEFAKDAGYSAVQFAVTHPQEAMAFGKGVVLGFTGSETKLPDLMPSVATASYLGKWLGDEVQHQVESLFQK